MTGEKGLSAKNLIALLKNPDGIQPHLQIHEKSGKIIHIFFQWDP
ncbi:hypothetical protein [Gilliamella sp. Nev3-1]|nr:hypothetical protein [Gilliamella apicola]